MRHIIALSLLLTAFWLINSGHYSVLMLCLGGVSVMLVLYIAYRMDAVDHQSQSLHWTVRMPGYWLWLLKEITLANLDVVARIWSGSKAISPVLFAVKADQKTDIGKVIFANSITLTPGTVAVDLTGDHVVTHALTQDAAISLLSGAMSRRVKQLEE